MPCPERRNVERQSGYSGFAATVGSAQCELLGDFVYTVREKPPTQASVMADTSPPPSLSVPGRFQTAVLAARISSHWILAGWAPWAWDLMMKTTWPPGFSLLSRGVNSSVSLLIHVPLGYEKNLLQLAQCLPKQLPSFVLETQGIGGVGP